MKKIALFRRISWIALSGIILFTASNCKKSETQPGPVPSTPGVSTLPAKNITDNSASINGLISIQGGTPVTAKGIVWSTAPNPVLTDNQTWEGSGPSEFTSMLPNLAPKTSYYARAYATNALGTSYGNTVTFKTADPPPPEFQILQHTSTEAGVTWIGFYFISTTEDVKINTIMITDPLPETFTIQESGMIWKQGEYHTLPNNGYIKYPGTWTFTFTGNIIKDNSAFSVSVTRSF